MNIHELKEDQKCRLIENRWLDSSGLWEMLSKTYDKNIAVWKNEPEWLKRIAQGKSKTRDNRVFLAVESVLNNLTGRPSKPVAIPANETDEAQRIADNLQEYYPELYRTLGVKKVMKRALRYQMFSRLAVIKVFWDKQKDDIAVTAVDPRKVRFSKTAATIEESEFAIEEIEKPIMDVIAMFPEQEESIKRLAGVNDEQILVERTMMTYKEAWIGGYVYIKYKNKILSEKPHPYYDFTGLKVTREERNQVEQANGMDRRGVLSGIRMQQEQREMDEGGQYSETIFFNHLNRPLPPYVFATTFEVEDKPFGETSLIEVTTPLQENIDERKRQFSDNARLMNGVWKFDTKHVTMSKQEAARVRADVSGIIYGDGVGPGVVRETGKELPAFLFNDLEHSIRELDSIFGTNNTFRGEQGGKETATGRAILREQSFSRLDEMIAMVDYLHEGMYNWWLQMMRVRYTERHLIKPLGAGKAMETIELMGDDIQDGVEVRVLPGQVLPEDRFFKSEKAFQDVGAGLIDPLTYFEETGEDNPMERAKRLMLYKVNPFSIVDLAPEDIQKLQEAQQLFGGQGQDQRAGQVAEARQRVEQLTGSPEFQRLPKEEQQAALAQIRKQFAAMQQAQ